LDLRIIRDLSAIWSLIQEKADYDRLLGEESDPHDLLRPSPSDMVRMWPHKPAARGDKDGPRRSSPVKARPWEQTASDIGGETVQTVTESRLKIARLTGVFKIGEAASVVHFLLGMPMVGSDL
jgi:hypothetical protein